MNARLKKAPTKALASHETELAFRVWCETRIYDEDPKPWKLVGAFWYLGDALDFIAQLQDRRIDCVYQSPADCRVVKATDSRVVYSPMKSCPKCGRPSGANGHIVNACCCDKDNLPTAVNYLSVRTNGQTNRVWTVISHGLPLCADTSMRDALQVAHDNFGRVTLPVWDGDKAAFDSELLADPEY